MSNKKDRFGISDNTNEVYKAHLSDKPREWYLGEEHFTAEGQLFAPAMKKIEALPERMREKAVRVIEYSVYECEKQRADEYREAFHIKDKAYTMFREAAEQLQKQAEEERDQARADFKSVLKADLEKVDMLTAERAKSAKFEAALNEIGDEKGMSPNIPNDHYACSCPTIALGALSKLCPKCGARLTGHFLPPGDHVCE